MTAKNDEKISRLTELLKIILLDIDEGTIDKQQLTDILNDHVERIANLENRIALLQDQINLQTDTVPGGVN